MSAVSRRWVIAGVLVLVVGSMAAAVFLGGGSGAGSASPFERQQPVVAVVPVTGVISGGSSTQQVLGGSVAGSETIMRQLRSLQDRPEVRAVVLRLNTPGGSAAASQETGLEIQRLADELPVVASMGDTAASGGYWLASQADAIVASPATTTGSIGVIVQITDLRALYDRLGIDQETIQSGPHKDMGSATSELTDEEREIFQQMVDDLHQQFVAVVAEGRDIPFNEVVDVADGGRTYTGSQAMEVGLVDDTGNLYDAIDRAAEEAGLGDNYQVERVGPRSPLEALLSLRLSGLDGRLTGGSGPSPTPLYLLPAWYTGGTGIEWAPAPGGSRR